MLVRNGYHSMKALWARAAKGGRQMQVSERSDTFEFRSPHGLKAAHSRLRTFAGIAVRHLQHSNHPGLARFVGSARHSHSCARGDR